MEDVKRKLESEAAGDSNKKRRVYDEVSDTSGPLTQEDVKYFRKQAIWRQMKYYKSKNEYNEEIITNLEKKVSQLVEDNQLVQKMRLQVLKSLNVDDAKDLVSQVNDVLSSKLTVDIAKLDEYIDEIAKLETENSVLKGRKVDLEIKVDDLTNKLFKQQERLKSELVNRVQKIKEEDSNVSTPQSSDDVTTGKLASESNKLATPSTTEDTKEVLEIKKLNEKYEQKIQELLRQKNELVEQVKAPVEVIKLESNSPLSTFNKSSNDDEKDNLIKKLTNKLNNYQELLNQELTKEIDILKDQLKKNDDDLVRVRNIRDELINKISIIEKQSNNETLMKLNQELNNQINFQDKCQDLEAKEIIKELEESYKRLVKESSVKIMNKIDQENLIKKYQIEKTKADQKYFQIMKLKDNLVQENKILKLTNAKTNEVIKTFEDIENKYKEKINKYEEMKSSNSKLLETIKHDNKNLSQDNNMKLIEINKMVSKFNQLSEELKTSKQNQLKLNNKLEEKDVEIMKLTKYKNLANQQNGNGVGSINEEELDGFRSMVKCSVCSKNWKDTAITVCGHVFCNLCTKERLNARLRRCPSCNKGFSSNDLLNIHL